MPQFRVILSTGHSRSFLVLVTSPRSHSPRFNCEKRCCYSAWLLQWLSVLASTWCVSSMSQQLPRYTPQTQLLKGSKPRKTPTTITKKTTNALIGSVETSKKHELHSKSDETSLWYHVKTLRKPHKNRELTCHLLSCASIYIQKYMLYTESNWFLIFSIYTW